MKGTTGQNREEHKPKTKAGARPESHGLNNTFTPWLVFQILDSFQPKWCTRIWHDKQRENEAIPIWNLIGALAENFESQ